MQFVFFLWPNTFEDAHQFFKSFLKCQTSINLGIYSRGFKAIIQEEVFDRRGMNFMQGFPSTTDEFILMVVDIYMFAYL